MDNFSLWRIVRCGATGGQGDGPTFHKVLADTWGCRPDADALLRERPYQILNMARVFTYKDQSK